MKNKVKSISICSVVFALILVTGCATQNSKKSGLSDIWLDKEYKTGDSKIEQVLIIGLADNLENRQEMEKKFADELASVNVTGIPSLQVLGANMNISRETVEAATSGTTIDGIIITELLQADESNFVKGDPNASYKIDREFYISVGAYEEAQHAPDYRSNIETKFIALLKISFYDLTADKIVWSANSLSIDPKSADDVIRAVTQSVVAELRLEKII